MSPLPGQRTFDPPEPTAHDKAAARRIGCTIEAYTRKRFEGFKWCSRGRHWDTPGKFAASAREKDGRATTCRACQAEYWRNYTRKPKPKAAS